MPTPRTTPPTPRTTPNRVAERVRHDRRLMHQILDEALVCHLAYTVEGEPRVLPTLHVRDGDTLYLHGSTGARSLRTAGNGAEVCATVTLLDGIVYARSLMHHSMNYRSAVVHGVARPVEGDEMLHGLRIITEHLAPGSWGYAREVNRKEAAAVAVLALDLAESSVKVRTGGPGDDPDDIDAGEVWAGVLPLRQEFGEPIAAADLDSGLAVPGHVTSRRAVTFV